MRKEDKNAIIKTIAKSIGEYDNFYLTDIASLNAARTTELRKECAKSDVKLMMVKNTLLEKALASLDGSYEELVPVLKGNTAIMFSNTANAPARLIAKLGKKDGVPSLKAAYVQDGFYVGAENLGLLENIKSREELLGDLIGLLQSPVKNVISALQSGGQTIHGVLETLSKR